MQDSISWITKEVHSEETLKRLVLAGRVDMAEASLW